MTKLCISFNTIDLHQVFPLPFYFDYENVPLKPFRLWRMRYKRFYCFLLYLWILLKYNRNWSMVNRFLCPFFYGFFHLFWFCYLLHFRFDCCKLSYFQKGKLKRLKLNHWMWKANQLWRRNGFNRSNEFAENEREKRKRGREEDTSNKLEKNKMTSLWTVLAVPVYSLVLQRKKKKQNPKPKHKHQLCTYIFRCSLIIMKLVTLFSFLFPLRNNFFFLSLTSFRFYPE